MDYCKIEIQQNAEAENKFNGTCNNFTSFAHRNAVQGKWQQQEEGVLNEVVQEEKRYRRSSPLAYRLSPFLYTFLFYSDFIFAWKPCLLRSGALAYLETDL